MRLSISELYELDAKLFIGMPHEQVVEKKIDALLAKKLRLSNELHSIDINEVNSYTRVSSINSEIKYLDHAITGQLADYTEMGLKYRSKL